MGIVELPVWRLRGAAPDRAALRGVVAAARPAIRVVRNDQGYCDRCAAPIEFGAVMRGSGTYCSVECSIDGPNRTA